MSDSMIHDVCTLILKCLVSCSCRKSPAKKAIQGHSCQIKKTDMLYLSLRSNDPPTKTKVPENEQEC